MLISVVIPTCNRNDLLIKCLDLLSLTNQTTDERYQVLVTDDSVCNIAEKVINENYPWVKWIEGPKKGPAANRNNGGTKVDGEWIVFIDDDCLPTPTILEYYKNAIIKYKDCLAFEGSIIPDDWDLMNSEMAECPINTEGNCFWSANVCIQKQLFIKIGGFDESFLIAAQEDQDIFEILKKHSVIPFLKECVVIHPVRYGSIKKKIKGIKVEFDNWLYYIKKHNQTNIKKLLFKNAKNHIKIGIKNTLSLKFRLMMLNSLKALYSIYLGITYKNC